MRTAILVLRANGQKPEAQHFDVVAGKAAFKKVALKPAKELESVELWTSDHGCVSRKRFGAAQVNFKGGVQKSFAQGEKELLAKAKSEAANEPSKKSESEKPAQSEPEKPAEVKTPKPTRKPRAEKPAQSEN